MEGHDRQRYKAWHRMMMMMDRSLSCLSNDLEKSSTWCRNSAL